MSEWVERLMPHLIVAPVLLPMLTAAVMLLLGEHRRELKGALNVGSALLGLGLALALLWRVDRTGPAVYLAANWPAPFGIVLVGDRLSALMLVLTGVLGVCALLFASARWYRAGVNFHPLSQLQLMGLAGAFLTGDLFNLFVFFEIMLAASYGLLLHGSGRSRVRAGVRYVAINLAASSLFLIGAAMLYGVTGTLNMADLARKIAEVPAADRGLLHAGAAILSVAFLAKAAIWPLNFWLVPAYTAATAPAGGLFAILTKVGIYAFLRLWTLLFSENAGRSAEFGGGWLLGGGLVSLVLAAVAMLGTQHLGRMAGFSVMVSSGTLLSALGFGQSGLTSGAIYYLLSSTLAASALLLLVDLVDRWRNAGETTEDLAPFLTATLEPDETVNLDDEERRLVGRPFPASTAFLGVAFLMCALLLAGLPPLSGFVGKLAMLSAALMQSPDEVPVRTWAFLAALIGSGLLSLVALGRAGIRYFWSSEERSPPRLRVAEGVPLVLLLAACVALTVGAGPVMRYTEAAAAALHSPRGYIDAVLGTEPVADPDTTAGRCDGCEP